MESQMHSEETSNRQTGSENAQTITVHVHPTTGGQFEIEISPDETAEELRRKISRRLQTPKERLKVLFKEQVLEAKPLKDYQIADGSKVTLLPSVESGFSSTVQGTQQSIIQAIESLSDPQIDDFLSGRLPLTLALRVGDHMMFVQLQLEQSQINSQNADPRPSRSRPSSQFSQISQSSPRLFADMSSATPLAATALYPKSPLDFNPKKSSSTGTPLCPVMAEPVTSGPAPKVPKLSPKSDATQQSDHEMSGVLHNSRRFHHHSTPSSPDEAPYAIFDPRFDNLHAYNQIASHINHHPQSGANHLRRLVTACSSLEQVVAIPPAGAEPLKVPPVPEHSRKSSRKRPSTLLTPNTNISPPRSSQRNVYPDNIGPSLPTAAAIIQNALLRHQQLSGGFPPLPLLSSAYAKYQASSRGSQGGSRSSPSSGSSSPTTPPAEIRQKHPITANMLQASSSGKSQSGSSARSDRHHHHHHKRVSTSGRVTSGSLSHHASGLSGARVARQMQRLRRLCGSHQQCVAYSNRELATEISSIVHMARHSHHHSRSEGSSHRKSHKACRECHVRDRSSAPGSTSGSPASTSGTQATGACIDTFTTHGPGIFSGTFSGSLHPSIQDADGKPKRDPKTILQILTDLLNATQQYQGQLGNVGLLPQIFKDHFKSDSPDTKADALEKAKSAASTSSGTQKPEPKQCAEKIRPTKQGQPTPAYQQQYTVVPQARPSVVGGKMPAPAQYLSSVSTIPIGNIPVAYAARHIGTRSSRRSSPNRENSKHHRHHHSRCHHHYKQHGLDKVCCTSSSCRRQAKHQMMSASYIKRDHENTNTRNKMKELKKMMEQKRHRRQSRRNANKLCNKRSVVEQTKQTTMAREEHPGDNNELVENPSAQGGVKSGKMEVQFDDIKDFEIKEVALEPPETVTV